MKKAVNEEVKEILLNYNYDLVDKISCHHWMIISIDRRLSEEFIKEFQDKVDWDMISKFQKLSNNFIKEFKDKLHLETLLEDNVISEIFYKELVRIARCEILDL